MIFIFTDLRRKLYQYGNKRLGFGFAERKREKERKRKYCYIYFTLLKKIQINSTRSLSKRILLECRNFTNYETQEKGTTKNCRQNRKQRP